MQLCISAFLLPSTLTDTYLSNAFLNVVICFSIMGSGMEGKLHPRNAMKSGEDVLCLLTFVPLSVYLFSESSFPLHPSIFDVCNWLCFGKVNACVYSCLIPSILSASVWH
ncbi:unnamed protein product [Calicophoron daubneyi]|uniref:Uncharacterized protein n=1 Tax=Calicophoron daubneyi TaxID=300641 RepID=A0AAV2TMD3_CALDB